jgi:hypothetical protein
MFRLSSSVLPLLINKNRKENDDDAGPVERGISLTVPVFIHKGRAVERSGTKGKGKNGFHFIGLLTKP